MTILVVALGHGLLVLLLWHAPRPQLPEIPITPVRALLFKESSVTEPVPPSQAVVVEVPRITLAPPAIDIVAAIPDAVPMAKGLVAPVTDGPPSVQVSGTTHALAAVAESPPRFDAGYLKNPQPDYPLVSRRRHEEGTVLLLVQVSADGAPAQVTVERTSGFSRLDVAALQAVLRWRFVPARRGPDAVVAWVVVPIEFSLSE